jgi:hypothetical protein
LFYKQIGFISKCSLKKLIYKICSCHDIVEILLNLIFAFIAVDRGFEPRSGHTKDYYIGICCFSAKHASLMRKSKDWFVKVLGNPFDDNFGPFLLSLFQEITFLERSLLTFPMSDRLRQV